MELISDVLRWTFTYVFYPAIVVGVFAYILYLLASLVRDGDGTEVIRRFVAALLPLVVLVFIVVSDEGPESISGILETTRPLFRFFVGAAVGTALMEAGKLLLKKDIEVGPALYAFFLSSVGVFLLYSIMIRKLQSMHMILLGLVVAGGLHIIFRGPPEI